WVFVGYAEYDQDTDMPQDFLLARDSLGQLLWMTPVPYTAASRGPVGRRTTSLDVLSDGSIVMAGWVFVCDVGWSYTSGVVRLDQSGGILWEHPYEFEEDVSIDVLALNGTDKIAASTTRKVMILDLNGEQLTEWDCPITPIQSMLWDSDTTILMLTDRFLLRMKWDGTPAGGQDLTVAGLDLVLSNDSIVVLTTDSIIRVAPDMVIGPRHSITGYPGTALELLERDGGLFIMTDEAIIPLDDTNVPQSLVELDLIEGHTIGDGVLIEDGLLTAGNMRYESKSAGIVRSYLMDGSAQEHDMDIGIEASVDSTWFEPWGSPALGALYSFVDIRVRITNHSTVVVNEIVLTTLSPFVISYCINESYNEYLHDLGLAPGASTEVVLHGLHWRYHADPPTTTYASDVCVDALSPNNLMDRSLENNHSCTTASFTNTVGMGEQSIGVFVQVSPNPFTDHIFLRSSTTGPLQLTLLDATGREVFTSRISSSSSTARIDLPDLTEGVYLLRTTDDKQQWTGRLVRAAE
ncbi:MAG: T9SS type A sorting domain-containing protein, partial [Flavobacteriales bacterium]|nr:T9SS type A sorting domain-containing protein [Flavobacteriales bacterium]